MSPCETNVIAPRRHAGRRRAERRTGVSGLSREARARRCRSDPSIARGTRVTETGSMTCYRHPGVPTGIVCSRCGRPICPACMVDAAVGFQCPECTKEGARQMRQGLLPYGVHSLGDRLGLVPRGVCLAANDPASYYPGVLKAACVANGDNWAAFK